MTTAREAMIHLHDKFRIIKLEHPDSSVSIEEMCKMQDEQIVALLRAVIDLGMILVKIEEGR